MEKVYYTVKDVKDFLGTLGFEWHGFCFTNENGVTLEAEEKIENFMIKENIDVFDTRPKGKYFAQLSVMSDEYDYDVRNDYFLFINDMSFVLRSTQYLSILDDFCEKENNYNQHILTIIADVLLKLKDNILQNMNHLDLIF